MELHKNLPVYLFQNAAEWEKWLHKNYDKFPAIWIKFAKKNSGIVFLTYDEALEAALCYGWIDGLLNKYDEHYYLIRFTPRKVKSVWSKRNIEIVERLIAKGKMQAMGLAAIEAAKTNSSWYSAYDSSKNTQMPDYFLKKLAKDKEAEIFFKSLNRA